MIAWKRGRAIPYFVAEYSGSKINRNRLVPVLWRNPCIGLSETAHYLAPVVLWKADNAR